MNVLFIPLSDVTNSEHKLPQFSISQAMYSNDHEDVGVFGDTNNTEYISLIKKIIL